MFEASCHCGNVKITCQEQPKNLTRCTCSICHRLATDWGYFSPANVTVSFTSEPTKTYSWGDKQIDFHHCPHCGCNTHYTARPGVESDRIAINMRMAPGELTKDLPLRLFDGADTWQFIECPSYSA